MAKEFPWQWGFIYGRKTATVIKPEAAGKLIITAKNPLMIVGAEAARTEIEGKLLIDYAVEIAKLTNIPIIATAHTLNEFLKRGVDAVSMGITEVFYRLSSGLRILEKEPDLVAIIGVKYYLLSQLLSSIKHFNPKIRTLSLDPYYQPNASMSFPNLPLSTYKKYLDIMIHTIIDELKRRGK